MSGSAHHSPDDLVPANNGGMHWSKIALDNVQVSSAYTTRQDKKQEATGFTLRARNVLKFQKLLLLLTC